MAMTTALYIISRGKRGPVKIGISSDPEIRLASLQAGNSRSLSLVWQRAFNNRSEAHVAERSAHLFLSDFRQVGEWFRISPALAIPAVEGCLA